MIKWCLAGDIAGDVKVYSEFGANGIPYHRRGLMNYGMNGAISLL